MSEDYFAFAWDLTAQIRMSIQICIAGWFMYRLLSVYFARRRSAGIGAIYGGALLILYWIPVEMESTVAYGAALAAACAAAALATPVRERLFAVLLCVSLYAVRIVASSIANAVYSSLYASLVHAPWAQADPQRQFAMFLCVSGAELLVFIFLLGLTVHVITRTWPEWHQELSRREFSLLLLPSVAAIAVYLALGYIRMRVDYSEEYVRLEWIAAVLMGIQFVVIVGSIMQFAAVTRETRRAARQDMLAAQALGLRQYVSDLDELYGGLRSFRHDVANHLETISALKAADAPASAAIYAEACRERMDAFMPGIRTGNPVTDVILSTQALQAERRGVQFFCDFRCPPENDVDPFDIAVILHNAGTNALEAAADCENPVIRVRSKRWRRAFLIEYENSFEGELDMDPSTGRPRSTKQKPGSHGIGLENVYNVAERYDGACEIWTQGGKCFLTVLLNETAEPAHNETESRSQRSTSTSLSESRKIRQKPEASISKTEDKKK